MEGIGLDQNWKLCDLSQHPTSNNITDTHLADPFPLLLNCPTGREFRHMWTHLGVKCILQGIIEFSFPANGAFVSFIEACLLILLPPFGDCYFAKFDLFPHFLSDKLSLFYAWNGDGFMLSLDGVNKLSLTPLVDSILNLWCCLKRLYRQACHSLIRIFPGRLDRLALKYRLTCMLSAKVNSDYEARSLQLSWVFQRFLAAASPPRLEHWEKRSLCAL